jgi:hypothetical protein
LLASGIGALVAMVLRPAGRRPAAEPAEVAVSTEVTA